MISFIFICMLISDDEYFFLGCLWFCRYFFEMLWIFSSQYIWEGAPSTGRRLLIALNIVITHRGFVGTHGVLEIKFWTHEKQTPYPNYYCTHSFLFFYFGPIGRTGLLFLALCSEIRNPGRLRGTCGKLSSESMLVACKANILAAVLLPPDFPIF